MTGFRNNSKRFHRNRAVLVAIAFCVLLNGCATYTPSNVNNVCQIFHGETDWYEAAKASNEKWGTPIWVMMAIMKQESHFIDDAKPPFRWFLFIPLGRSSSAYGYAQALDSTWKEYIQKTGNHWADRDDFDDAVDFIGWYTHNTQRRLAISKWDAYNQYLAYHEGHGGYKRGTWKSKGWLKNVANKVKNNASNYNTQLKSCQPALDKKVRGWFS